MKCLLINIHYCKPVDYDRWTILNLAFKFSKRLFTPRKVLIWRKTARMFLFVIRTPEWQRQCYQTEALMPISSHSLLPFQPLSFWLCKNTPDYCGLFSNEFQLILPSSNPMSDYLHRLLHDYGSCFHHVQMFTLLSLY